MLAATQGPTAEEGCSLRQGSVDTQPPPVLDQDSAQAQHKGDRRQPGTAGSALGADHGRPLSGGADLISEGQKWAAAALLSRNAGVHESQGVPAPPSAPSAAPPAAPPPAPPAASPSLFIAVGEVGEKGQQAPRPPSPRSIAISHTPQSLHLISH